MAGDRPPPAERMRSTKHENDTHRATAFTRRGRGFASEAHILQILESHVTMVMRACDVLHCPRGNRIPEEAIPRVRRSNGVRVGWHVRSSPNRSL